MFGPRPTPMSDNRPNSMSSNSEMGNGAGINVDDIIKKIDAKIAEIEKEEQQKKQQNNITEEPKSTIEPKLEVKEEKVPDTTPKEKLTIDDLLKPSSNQEIIPKEENLKEDKKLEEMVPVNEPKPIIHEEKIPPKEDNISDDQFFDDFFDD